jgi:hypothetical protein
MLFSADSPRAFFAFLEMVYALGIDELIADYLGERPALSVEKTVLRRADASLPESTWHQDGAFVGDGIRTVDASFALSPCGRDARPRELVLRAVGLSTHLDATRRVGGPRLTSGAARSQRTCMAEEQPSGNGTLVIAALLVLALVFSCYWILSVVNSGERPSVLWFGLAAALVVTLGFLSYGYGFGRGR